MVLKENHHRFKSEQDGRKDKQSGSKETSKNAPPRKQGAGKGGWGIAERDDDDYNPKGANARGGSFNQVVKDGPVYRDDAATLGVSLTGTEFPQLGTPPKAPSPKRASQIDNWTKNVMLDMDLAERIN
mgnify:CR=1 FL=1